MILADVDPTTGLMGPDHLEAALAGDAGRRARAVYPVHLNGRCAYPEALRAVADKHGLTVIEDACHALGTTWHGRDGNNAKIGSCAYSDMAVFSLPSGSH